MDMPSETVIDVLCYCSRPVIDAFLLVGRTWHKAISKLSNAMPLHMVDRCTVRSCVTRNERDVDDLTDVAFYVSMSGRRFDIPRLNMAASEQDFDRLRIALAHLRNAKSGVFDLPIEAGFPALFKRSLGDGYVLNVSSVIIRTRDQVRFAVDSTNATKLIFYDHCCMELILGTTPCKRQVDLAIQQGTNANFFKDLVERFRNLADTSGTRRQVAFPATSFMLNEFCGYSHDDLPTDEVQNRLNGSAEQCWVRYTIRYVNAFTGSELVLLFFAPRSKRYCVKYAEMIVLEAE
ncbi:hypothetical protein AAVH_32736 [Aphelenchoides avenae]|nr:hypothetical protein AAVH_32736 [Aphelenchus avenae]